MSATVGCEDCGAVFASVAEISARCLPYCQPIVVDADSIGGYVWDIEGDTIDAVAEAIGRRLEEEA